MNWDFFVQQLVNGVTLGSVYALIALGYTMVYGILKLLNFAHGEVYMMGAFAGYAMLTAFGGALELSINVVALIAIMLGVAMLGTGLLGVVIERFAYRPLRNAPRIAPLISALGVSFFLQSSALLLFGADFRSYDLRVHRSLHGHPLGAAQHLCRPDHGDPDVGGADDRSHAACLENAARQGDARHCLRPRSRRDAGNRRRPGDRRRPFSSARPSRARPG